MTDGMIAQHEYLIYECKSCSGLIRINDTIFIVINSELSQSEKLTEIRKTIKIKYNYVTTCGRGGYIKRKIFTQLCLYKKIIKGELG
ncbi:hypothetical protein BS613_15655 [Listeria monocytogenes]|nr:hypothetical protein AP065_11210 [Listeria monocytogenes]ORI34032.1 hypothetical protein BS613_15655 [Listeria monocytogenes]